MVGPLLATRYVEAPSIYVPRTFWCDAPSGERERIEEKDLPGRRECMVVLGEPGMGKSSLLERLATSAGFAFCTARKLIRNDPRALIGGAPAIVVDALDEVAGRQDGDAVDLVLRQLVQAGTPRFVLSCRVADWQAATYLAAIGEEYPDAPLQLHLEPLNHDDQLAVLRAKVGKARAAALIEHFQKSGLDVLGNPQTLDLVARLPGDQALPTSRSELFRLAVETLRVEHRDGLRRQELPKEVALGAAGAAFASLILTGGSTIRRGGQANLKEGELPIAEVDALANGHLARVLDTRLFSGGGDRFTYVHRRLGEFVGAAWLARRADTRAKRRRLLRLFQADGLVPTHLRGLHAWLARDPHLADAVIAADPMGVVEYGDVDVLAAKQAEALFAALEELARRQPRFWRGGAVQAGGLVRGHLEDATRRVICDPIAPLAFRLLLLEQIEETRHGEPYRDVLRSLLLDPSEVFALRWLAGAALAKLAGEDWPGLVEKLRQKADQDSARLAYELMLAVGLDAFSDREIVEVVLTFDGLILCDWPRKRRRRLALQFRGFPDHVPPERLDGLLDELAPYLSELLLSERDLERSELTDALYGLALRRLDVGSVETLRLWRWLWSAPRRLPR